MLRVESFLVRSTYEIYDKMSILFWYDLHVNSTGTSLATGPSLWVFEIIFGAMMYFVFSFTTLVTWSIRGIVLSIAGDGMLKIMMLFLWSLLYTPSWQDSSILVWR